jgi:hypothetical protein
MHDLSAIVSVSQLYFNAQATSGDEMSLTPSTGRNRLKAFVACLNLSHRISILIAVVSVSRAT